ncbi:MAG: transketolase [Lentisphaeria bacterium]|nr:transketolase [Lentisphaeria bacterium]
MRNQFAATLLEQAGMIPELVLLSGDIGNRLFDPFKQAYPERFFNCGIAEAAMTGVAAGMAMTGLRPVTYTIASFNSYRCYEQIRLDVCCHNLPVIIAAVGAGLSYAPLNPTHHSLEDLALMRVLPNMTVLNPADSLELSALLKQAIRHDGPVYLRFGKKNEPKIHEQEPELKIGQWLQLREGDPSRPVLLSSGIITPEAVKAADELVAELWSCPSIKPLDDKVLLQLAKEKRRIVTIEEHSIRGGFGSAVSEFYAEHGMLVHHLAIGTPDRFLFNSASVAAVRQETGLDADSLVKRIGAVER